jgi:hypothetical protein
MTVEDVEEAIRAAGYHVAADAAEVGLCVVEAHDFVGVDLLVCEATGNRLRYVDSGARARLAGVGLVVRDDGLVVDVQRD